MSTRRIILIVLVLLLVFGIGNFLYNSIQTRSQLAMIAGSEPAQQEAGVQRLMARGALFDALQGGAPPQTRRNAIAALQRSAADGKNPDAFRQLLQMLKDPDTESAEAKTHPVRDAATAAVAAVGTAYPDLLLDAAKDQDGAIRDQSRAALKTIGAPLQNQMAARLDDAGLRAPLGDILAGIGPQTIPLIAPFLQTGKLPPADKPDDREKAKIELIEILGKFKVREAAVPILPYQNDPNPNVRRTVVTALSNIAVPIAAPVLIAALQKQETDSDARAAAASALGAIASPDANTAMRSALRDLDRDVAVAAAAGLKRAGDAAATAIAQALADPDPTVRTLAADAAGGVTAPGLSIRALTDPDPRVRAAAATAIGEKAAQSGTQAGMAESVAALMTALRDTEGNVASAASGALSAIGKPAIPTLVSALGQNDTVAYYAAQSLRGIGAEAIQPLMNAARSSGPSARWAAIALEQIGDPKAVPALEALAAQTSDSDTRYVAERAVARLRS